MSIINRIAITVFLFFSCPGCMERDHHLETVSVAATESKLAEILQRKKSKDSKIRGYRNKVNRLVERRIIVKDREGKPAVPIRASKKFQDVELKIIWAFPTDYGGNYSLPELYEGKDAFDPKFQSRHIFVEKKLQSKSILEILIPDTPYTFFLLNGRVSPYFYDSQKDVIWHLKSKDLEGELLQMTRISVSSKKVVFSPYSADVGISLKVDFTDRENSPKITYSVVYHGH